MADYGIDVESQRTRFKEVSVLADASRLGLIKERGLGDTIAKFLAMGATGSFIFGSNQDKIDRARHETVVRSAMAIADARGDKLNISIFSDPGLMAAGLATASSQDVKECLEYIGNVVSEHEKRLTQEGTSTKWQDAVRPSQEAPDHSRSR
jgi:hypothetical protein